MRGFLRLNPPFPFRFPACFCIPPHGQSQDLFHDRCVDLIEFVRIVSDFIKLEKIYLGNTKGAVLTGVLRTIHEEFMTAMAAFRAAPYDVADVRRPEFDAHFFAFKTTIQVRCMHAFGNPLRLIHTKNKDENRRSFHVFYDRGFLCSRENCVSSSA